MAEDRAWVPPGVDTGKASPARVYDYWLGGTHNFQADRDAARAIIAVQPHARGIARANRDFLARAVGFLAEAGISQFLDIGSGIPTQGNVHEVARRRAPGSRVMYVDTDPVAVAHSQAMLAGEEGAGVVRADLREPEVIMAEAQASGLIDFRQPAGLVLGAVLHFLPDSDRPWQLVRTFRDALAPGSYLVLSHASSEDMAGGEEATITKAYQGRVASRGRLRSRAEIERYFEGFELVEPGLVLVADWRPATPPGEGDESGRYWFLAGVGRKP